MIEFFPLVFFGVNISLITPKKIFLQDFYLQ